MRLRIFAALLICRRVWLQVHFLLEFLFCGELGGLLGRRVPFLLASVWAGGDRGLGRRALALAWRALHVVLLIGHRRRHRRKLLWNLVWGRIGTGRAWDLMDIRLQVCLLAGRRVWVIHSRAAALAPSRAVLGSWISSSFSLSRLRRTTGSAGQTLLDQGWLRYRIWMLESLQ